MTPRVFIAEGLTFRFWSLEEERMHVHVQCDEGEAKIWIEPKVEIARNYGLRAKTLNLALRLAKERKHEIEERWRRYHGT